MMIFRFRKNHDPYLDLAKDLNAYALALVRDMDVAEDLVQDTLVKIYQKTELLKNSDINLKPYAFRMLRNLHIDNIRKEKIRWKYSDEFKRLSHDDLISKMDTEDQFIVREAFALLTEEHQEILILIDILGFKYAEAAETLDIAIGTVMSRVSRARKEMILQLETSPNTSCSPNSGQDT